MRHGGAGTGELHGTRRRVHRKAPGMVWPFLTNPFTPFLTPCSTAHAGIVCMMQGQVTEPVRRRRKLQVYVPNPHLDLLLTLAFLGLSGFVLHMLWDEKSRGSEFAYPLFTFGVFVVGVALLIVAVKWASVHVASGLNVFLVWAGLVDKAPIVGRAQLRKWQDQSWQLTVHVSMLVFEVYLLVYDCPGMWTDTRLAWVPSPFVNYKPSTVLQRFYLLQLVRAARMTS